MTFYLYIAYWALEWHMVTLWKVDSISIVWERKYHVLCIRSETNWNDYWILPMHGRPYQIHCVNFMFYIPLFEHTPSHTHTPNTLSWPYELEGTREKLNYRHKFAYTYIHMKSQIFLKHITFADTHKNRGIHPYEYVHTQPTHMSIFERFNRFDLKIQKVTTGISMLTQMDRCQIWILNCVGLVPRQWANAQFTEIRHSGSFTCGLGQNC
jgi:hypothetical protein